ncbi:unnamed protein product [Calicophoron daubneyi]|uniref:protein-tyrosine-phosphatase n=1 Tax=Calicophoron daubneyi TaxID=300641 RepID=A0AAV2TEA8_CALDB
MNEIVPGLWLGSYPFKEGIPQLFRNGIKSILTVDIAPLSEPEFNYFKLKFFNLRDEPSEDILDWLAEALDFIEHSLAVGGILVHCTMGVSRSAAIVIAYLMRKHSLSYDKALEFVTKRRLVYPNVGFVNQLKLFESMNWTVNKHSPVYVRYVNNRKHKGPQDVYRHDLPDKAPGKNTDIPSIFRCRKCRYQLFTSANLVSHCKPEEDVRKFNGGNTSGRPGANGKTEQEVCSVLIKGITLNKTPTACDLNEIFTDPLEWTRESTDDVEGKLYCPGCNAKLGSFNWCGEPCVCRTWVIPAFHFNRNHIDRIERRPGAATQKMTSRASITIPSRPPSDKDQHVTERARVTISGISGIKQTT